MTKRTEVIVVGAGPAGIAAAIAVQRLGLDPIILDSRMPPIDKPCGEGILPGGVAALKALGISLPQESAFPYRAIRFVNGEDSVRADFSGATGFSMRRVKLHEHLVEQAVEAGVEFRWGTRVTQIDKEFVTTAKEKIGYRWLIGADGHNSMVRKWAGLETRTNQSIASRIAPGNRFGFCNHFRLEPWSDAVEVHWAQGCQVFITPLPGNEVGVAVISRDPQLRLERALPQFPELAEQLRGATPTTRESGDTTSLRIFPAIARGRVALIGDASGTVDAVTGHGLSLSFQQAVKLAEAIKSGDLGHYQHAHKQIAAVPVAMSRLMRLMSGNDWIRGKTIRAFLKTPALFSRMLAIHTESQPISSLGAAEIAGFGWNFLRT